MSFNREVSSRMVFKPDGYKMPPPVYKQPETTCDELVDQILELAAYREYKYVLRQYEEMLAEKERIIQSRYFTVEVGAAAHNSTECLLCKQHGI